ncbi:MAG: hypothetical protein IPL19_32585 [Sandaracinaceae bacterium]|nr:hypothetical protein [Sandaracinaceae bacterium]MBK7773670.1 hypothetical protein [Sandaracinaceae bacterium]MBK8412700.1 hypothetical protein [Sandaracinaceae bacterium]
MKSLLNKTPKPMRLSLPGGKTLFLGGTRQANVREDALEHPPIKKLIEAGTLEVVEGASTKRAASSNQALAGGGQAHAPRAKVQSGDR